ncbi:glycosyltransferase [Paenimyroides aestuarii]|uniref:Glycosyltransferase n=1 Tax=Paenimyroides aestuarii TaxID=2968490 RepID=A0ABY5NQX9_9FLAO|nr:glycosyltransferase [Paenimyroides aestuarii]UUV20943.1 glycosyltransferase [Paenimyroides aestuarii]
MSIPLVSVICICFNHEAFVQQALLSVLNQTYKNIEIIVINNGSSDNSEKEIQEVVQNHPKIKYIKRSETISNTQAFNLGVKKSAGTFLIDLSADDCLLPKCIEKQVAFFMEQPEEVGIVFGNAYHIDENGNRTKPFFEVDNKNKVIDKALFKTDYIRILGGGNIMCSVASMITRKHFMLLNGYNEELFFEDLDYWLRLSKKYKIAFLDAFLVEKRYLKQSLGNQFYKNDEFSRKINQSLRRIFKESLTRNTSKAEHKALLKRIHYSMEQSFKNKRWIDLLKFCIIELKCRFYLLK